MQKEFGRYFDLNDAYEADELAAHEKIFGEHRKVDNATPSNERREKFTMPEVRSTQSGGSGTRRRIGTEEEQRAIVALRCREKGKGKDQDIEAKAVRRRPHGSRCLSIGPRILGMFDLGSSSLVRRVTCSLKDLGRLDVKLGILMVDLIFFMN